MSIFLNVAEVVVDLLSGFSDVVDLDTMRYRNIVPLNGFDVSNLSNLGWCIRQGV